MRCVTPGTSSSRAARDSTTPPVQQFAHLTPHAPARHRRPPRPLPILARCACGGGATARIGRARAAKETREHDHRDTKDGRRPRAERA